MGKLSHVVVVINSGEREWETCKRGHRNNSKEKESHTKRQEKTKVPFLYPKSTMPCVFFDAGNAFWHNTHTQTTAATERRRARNRNHISRTESTSLITTWGIWFSPQVALPNCQIFAPPFQTLGVRVSALLRGENVTLTRPEIIAIG